MLFFGVEIDEQIVHIVQDDFWPRVSTVDLIENNDRREPPRQRLAQRVARLRQGAFAGIFAQHHPTTMVSARSISLTEVAVARRVYNVDLRIRRRRWPCF